MEKPIFCIIGKSGSGKSTFLDALMKDDRIRLAGFIDLKYHTTRDKRYPEEDGYYFSTIDEYHGDTNIIESRRYQVIDNTGNPKSVYYYTTTDDLTNKDCNGMICAASVEQVLNYKIYSEAYDNNIPIYVINIVVSTINARLNRIFERCNNTDGMCLEICRRVLAEEDEYSKISEINQEDILTIYNDDEDIMDNIDKIIEFIYDKSF